MDHDACSCMQVQDLETPALLVDYERLISNIKWMAKKARENSVSLRPHIKTHKCVEIARLQQKHGDSGITVSTLGEALVFAEAGFSDMTLAVPLGMDRLEAVCQLAARVSLKVLIDHPKTKCSLEKTCRELGQEIDVLVKVDCGYHRCGVDPNDPASIRLVRGIVESAPLDFAGILTHGGHAYSAKSIDEMRRVALEEQNAVLRFAERLRKEEQELAPEVVSIGSTPTARIADSFEQGVTEIRPGNYVFFDYHQVALGSCEVAECALSTLSSVIGSYDKHFVIDAGATALSKDEGPIHVHPDCGYGRIFVDYNQSQLANDANLRSLSQEHGNVILGQGSKLSSLVPGDKVRILPNHSCLTANLFGHYYVVEKDLVRDTWEISRDRSHTKLVCD